MKDWDSVFKLFNTLIDLDKKSKDNEDRIINSYLSIS